uniref:Adhesion G-protein coupled receptor G1 n=1 Tax=Amazona collaria TaxID=241587 RepID=A0A8B9GL49_9PSIT
ARLNHHLQTLVYAGAGACGHQEEDFRFCGDRNQTQNSSIIYEHGPAAISIENRAQALIIRRPFLPSRRNSSYKYSLPPTLGRYRFCVCWFRANSTLRLVYGKQSFLLGRDLKASSACVFHGIPFCMSSSHTRGHAHLGAGCGGATHCLGQAHCPAHRARCRSHGAAGASAVSSQLMPFLLLLMQCWLHPTLRPFPDSKLGELEQMLTKVELEGQNQTFGKATVRCPLPASVLMSLSLQEDREVHGIMVDLPSSLFMMAKEREEMIEHRVVLMDISSQTMFQDENSSHVLGDKVVGISLVDMVVANLSDPVILTFSHGQLNVTPLCVFWREDTTANSGSWDSFGCTTETGGSWTKCRCNHLTYFAVLMVSSLEITYIHRDYLSIITYVGCLISALASVCTILFLYFRSKQRDQITSMHIHMNLLGAIFLLDITFLISEQLASSSSEAVCRAGGLFLHFSLLSCLTWMGIEGYNLYRLVIEVFSTYHDHFLLKICLVGWGLPFFCVMLIFLASWRNYGPFSIPIYESIGGKSTNATICWITNPLIHNIVNLGFFSLVFLFNSVMLGAMVREILRQSNKGHKLKHVLALFGLSILLGIPWALVFFSFTSGVFSLISLYLFTIINSLQGELGMQDACEGVLVGWWQVRKELSLAGCCLARENLPTLSPMSPRLPHLSLVLDHGAAGEEVL